MDTEMAKVIRTRLLDISDELRAAKTDDLDSILRLKLEAGNLRKELAELESDDVAEYKKEWAARSARDQDHTVDDEARAAKTRLTQAPDSYGALGLGQ